ncbi:MAG: peptide ABC transporter substrate-binding protein [Gemmatimonadota bacterium]|nr:peptide ABC transporter substrate-binding protein [Gemmatimonadota bacterium]
MKLGTRSCAASARQPDHALSVSAVAAGAIGLLLLVGCGREVASTSGGGTLVVSSVGDADYLFPPLIVSAQGRQVAEQIFEPLADIGDSLSVFGDGGFIPRLADSWTWARDSMSIAFHLNPRARWHDGKPVRARDVQFTFALNTNPALAAPIAPLLSNIDSVSIADTLTPVFWFKHRSAQQFYDAADVALILPEHVYGAVPVTSLASSEVLRHPVGSGRFRFARWIPNETIEIVSNPAHYRKPAQLNRVIWMIAPGDFSAAATRFLVGEADFFGAVRPEMIEQISKLATLRVIEYPGFKFGYMVFNMRDPAHAASPHPLFRDAALRRALTLAVDRRVLVQSVFDSLALPSIGPAVRAMPTTDTTVAQIPYDTARASQLLDSLGWKMTSDRTRARAGRPLAFTIMVPSSSKDREKLAVLMQDQLSKIGVRVTILSVEPNVFERQQTSHNFDAAIEAWVADPSPGGILESWGTAAARTDGSKNFGDYANELFDARVDSALSARNREEARDVYRRAFQTLISDAPAIWLFEPRSVVGVAKRVHVAPMRADAWWAHLADWYVPAGEQIPRDMATGVAASQPVQNTRSAKRSN